MPPTTDLRRRLPPTTSSFATLVCTPPCGGSVLPRPASLLVSREPEGDVQWPLSPGWPHVAGLAGALPVLLPMVAIQQCQSWI